MLRNALTSLIAAAVAAALAAPPAPPPLSAPWGTFGGDLQHSGLSRYPSGPMDRVIWSWEIDRVPPPFEEYFGHYGSPLISRKNTVVFPIRMADGKSYRFEAADGRTGTEIWHFDTDFVEGPANAFPAVSGSMAHVSSFAMPGVAGSVHLRANVDAPTSGQEQLLFYGKANYQANKAWCDAHIAVTTPILADDTGTMWFGYFVGDLASGAEVAVPAGFPNLGHGGIARVGPGRQGTWVDAGTAAGDPLALEAPNSCSPALSNDGSSVYAVVSFGPFHTSGYLLKLNALTLATEAKVMPTDPYGGPTVPARILWESSACPMVGPDGDVYFGVYNASGQLYFRESHGWLMHYDSNLNPKGAPGSFGWDTTPSVVPASCVPQYHGPSTYLILTKYNNYVRTDFSPPWNSDLGADGQNKVAILDPNDASGVDRIALSGTGGGPPSIVPVMKEVITVTGVTPDNPAVPGSVAEWCLNAAAIDPFNNCAFMTSEDGSCYRWDFASNSLQPALGASVGFHLADPQTYVYTPTVIGPDGTVYAFCDRHLYAIGPAG